MKKLNTLLTTHPETLKLLLGSTTAQEFLSTYLKLAREVSPTFSFGQLALKAKLSKTLMKSIFDGKRRITPKTRPAILKALDLPKHLDTYLNHLIALEDPGVPEARTRKALKKFSQLATEEYQQMPPSDGVFSQVELPFVYSALGTIEKGAQLSTIVARTKLPRERVREHLQVLVETGLVRLESEHYFAVKQFSFLHGSSSGSNLHQFYLNLLTKQKRAAEESFDSKTNLFFASVFSVRKGLEFKAELRALLNKYVEEAEDPEGEELMAIQLFAGTCLEIE